MKRDLFEVDTEREEAMREIGRRADRLHTGRLYVEVHKLAGRVVEYRIREDRTTEREVERVMQERPQPKEKRMRQTHNPDQDADAKEGNSGLTT